MKRKRTVVSPSQLSVVEPSKSFFLEMLVFTVESKADFSVAPGAGRGGPEGGGGPGEQSLSAFSGVREPRAALLRVGTCPEELGVSSGHWEPHVPAGDSGPLRNHKGLGSAQEMGMGREGGRD